MEDSNQSLSQIKIILNLSIGGCRMNEQCQSKGKIFVIFQILTKFATIKFHLCSQNAYIVIIEI